MKAGLFLPLGGALALAGCAETPSFRVAPRAAVTAPRPKAAMSAEAARAVSLAAEQVKRCYRSPRVPAEGREIVTRLRVAYAPDGTLAGVPEVAAQQGVRPETAPYAPVMAQAAIAAVVRCAPLVLPAGDYAGGWDAFDLIFSPSARG